MFLADLQSRGERAGNAECLGASGMYYTDESAHYFAGRKAGHTKGI